MHMKAHRWPYGHPWLLQAITPRDPAVRAMGAGLCFSAPLSRFYLLMETLFLRLLSDRNSRRSHRVAFKRISVLPASFALLGVLGAFIFFTFFFLSFLPPPSAFADGYHLSKTKTVPSESADPGVCGMRRSFWRA